MEFDAIAILLATAANPPGASTSIPADGLDAQSAGRAMSLILLVALIGIIAVFGLLLWFALDRAAAMRRKARPRARRTHRHPEVPDPWTEAGQRIEPDDGPEGPPSPIEGDHEPPTPPNAGTKN